MKKFTVLALAVLLLVAFTVPASAALENTFGGYWRTRMYMQRDFAGDSDAKDATLVDTRTRLYYTAKLNDNLKFVNKFEFDSIWGSATGYGRVGTDAVAVEIKNTYADFKIGQHNFLVGAQPFTLARGFLSDEDGVGIKAIFKVSDGVYLPFIWQKAYEGHDGYTYGDRNDMDVDMFIFTPIIYVSKDIKINPYYVYLWSKNGVAFSTVNPAFAAGSFDDLEAHILGLDFDAKFGAVSLWFTGIMQMGTSTATGAASTAGLAPGSDLDNKGYLYALGGKFDMGKADVHGQVFYASGEENGLADGEANGFLTTGSTYYYWAEILGRGIFDNQDPINVCGFKVTNMFAANVGAKFKPMDKMTIAADVWYAKLAEETAYGEDEVGIETDLVISYQLVDGLMLDIVGAYLFAGDAVSAGGKNKDNPYEVGTRLSLSF